MSEPIVLVYGTFTTFAPPYEVVRHLRTWGPPGSRGVLNAVVRCLEAHEGVTLINSVREDLADSLKVGA